MDRLRRRFVMLVVSVALILFASFLAAQGPPGCANACWQAYTNKVNSSGLRPGLRPATTVIHPVRPMHPRHLRPA